MGSNSGTMNGLVLTKGGHHLPHHKDYHHRLADKADPQPANGKNSHHKPSRHQTLHVDEVDFMFKEPFIHTGYRFNYQSWTYYLSSFFWLHNESLNVWTHFIGCMAILVRTLYLGMEMDGFRDPRSPPVIGLVLACILNNLLSSSAHLLHSKSHRHHYILYFMDYAGISFYNLGNAVGSMYSCSHPDTYATMKGFYLPVVVFLSWLSFLVCVLARLHFKGQLAMKRKFIMLVVYVLLCGFVAYPMVRRYTDCVQDEHCSLSSLNHISIVFFFFALSALCYSAHAPERWLPGGFDIWGHSHQWFHVSVSVTQQLQLHALHVELVEQGRGKDTLVDFGTVLTALLVLAGAAGLTVGMLSSAVDAKVADNAAIHQDKKTG